MCQNYLKRLGKRSMSFGMSLVMALSLLPAVPAVAANGPNAPKAKANDVKEEVGQDAVKAFSKPDVKKAGSIPVSEGAKTYGEPFAPFTAGSENFRIPTLITLQNGDLLAAGDARWEEWNDGGGTDSIASVSDDGGKTWNYSFPIYFPDSYGYEGRGGIDNGGGSDTTTIIDPGVVEGPDGTIYFIADVNPAGSTTMYKTIGTGTGYVSVGEERKKHLALTESYSTSWGTAPTDGNITAYPYYIGDFENGYAPILKREDSSETGYGVDEWYNLYSVRNGEYVADLMQTQTNSDTQIQQNVFYKASKFHVYNIDYLWVVRSRDHGRTWEAPLDITPQIKRDDEGAILVSPGKGISTKDGNIVIGMYNTLNTACASMLYSSNGDEWKRTGDIQNVGGMSSENEIVELEDGTLRMFYRGTSGKLCWADITKDADGAYEMGSKQTMESLTVDSNCNLSVLSVSKKIDNKQVLLVSCPGAFTRTDGKIFSFLVGDNNAMELHRTFTVPGGGNGNNAFVYSCLTELEDGRIGLLWEPNHSTMYFDTFELDEILGASEEAPVENLITLEKGQKRSQQYESESKEFSVTTQPDAAVANMETKVGNLTKILRDHTSDTANSLSSFSEEINSNIYLEDMEYTFTSVAKEGLGKDEAVYTVYNEAAKKYFCNERSEVCWFPTTHNNDLLFKKKVIDGKTGYQISKDELVNGKKRNTIFFMTKMRFDAMSVNNGVDGESTDVMKYELFLLEENKGTAEEEIIPGYVRASEIKDGGKYLITYIWEKDGQENVFVLYPGSASSGNFFGEYTKLVGSQDQMERSSFRKTVTFEGVGEGETTAVVDGISYKIKVEDNDNRIVLGTNDTYEIKGASAVTTAPSGVDGIKAEAYDEPEYGLFDHVPAGEGEANSLKSFSETKREDINIEDAELTFTSAGQNGYFQITSADGKKHLKDRIFDMNLFSEEPFETGMGFGTVTGEGKLKIFRGDFEKNAFGAEIKGRYNNNMGWIVFYYPQMDFRSYGTGVKADGQHGINPYGQHASYKLTLLQKKGAGDAAEDCLIPGYKLVSAAGDIVSGEKYLIAFELEDGSVAVLYPGEDTASQTKLAKRVSRGVRISSGNATGTASVTVDGQEYQVVVADCTHETTSVRGKVDATCTKEGYTGDTVCSNASCGKVMEEGEVTRVLGHDWSGAGTLTTQVTASADGKITHTCAHEGCDAIKEEVVSFMLYGKLLAEYEKAGRLLAEDKKAMYLEEGLTALQTAYTAAGAVAAPAAGTVISAQMIQEHFGTLLTASQNVLIPRAEAEDAVTDAMKASKALADAGKKAYYAEDKWTALEDAYADAGKLTVETAAYTVLTTMADRLVTARRALVKTGLAALYAENESLTQGQYNEESWAVFVAARTAAKKVLDQEDAAKDAELETALFALDAAVEGLMNSTEARAPYVSFTAPSAGQAPKAARVRATEHADAVTDRAKDPANLVNAVTNKAASFQALDGLIGFNASLRSETNNDKFDVFGDTPLVVSMKLYVKSLPTSDIGLISKGNKQYGLQLGSAGLQWYTNKGSEWPTVKFKFDETKLNKWLDVTTVFDGKGEACLIVDGEINSQITPDRAAGMATPSHIDRPFAIGCRVDSENPDQIFTTDYGYMSDVKFYSGKELTAEEKEAFSIENWSDSAVERIEEYMETQDPTAQFSSVPYAVETTWSTVGADAADMGEGDMFAEDTAYQAKTVFTALGDYEFPTSSDYLTRVEKNVSTGRAGVSANASVVENKLTVTVTYPTCPCKISSIDLEDFTVTIPRGVEKEVTTIEPALTLDGDGCTDSAHPGALMESAAYAYEVIGDDTGATVDKDGKLTVTKGGVVELKVTASLTNGAVLSKVIKVTVENESVKNCIVKFNKNDGTEDECAPSQTVEAGSLVNKPSDPEWTGYHFIGWYTDKEGTEEFDFTKPVSADTTIYAKWEKKDVYTVTFNANGGNGAPAAVTVEEGKPVAEPTTKPTRTGYVFDGWYKDEAGTQKYDFSAAVTDNITLYAKWKEDVSSGDEETKKEEAKKDRMNALTDASKIDMETGSQKYTENTWNAFKAAYDKLNSMTDEQIDGMTADELKELVKALTDAQGALLEINVETPEKEQAKKDAADALAEAGKINQATDAAKYTADTWQAFVNAYNALHSLTDEQIKNMPAADLKKLADALTAAQKALKPAPAQESYVTSVKFNLNKYEIAKSKSINLAKEINQTLPADAKNKTLTYQSLDPKVATVTAKGVVKTNKKAAKKTARIAVQNAAGQTVATVKVKVMNGSVTKVKNKSNKTLTVKAGKSVTLKTTVSSKGGKPVNKKLKWTTSNSKLAMVGKTTKSSVKVTIAKGAKNGKKVKITATSMDGTNKKVVFTIKIKK